MGIKALLLNQKRVVSGVGNWIADEVLYQSRLHPEQAYLTLSQATTLKEKLDVILNTAIECNDKREDFPSDWLFNCRWGKRSANSGNKIKDPEGRNVVFVKAAGRTSAIVPSIQVNKRSQKPKKNSSRTTPQKRKTSSSEKPTRTRKKRKTKKGTETSLPSQKKLRRS